MILVFGLVLVFMFYYGLFRGGLYIRLVLSLFVVYVGIKEVLGDDYLYSLGMKINYECGFESFESRSEGYSIQFFIIRLSFMLFDLEICLFMPAVYSG